MKHFINSCSSLDLVDSTMGRPIRTVLVRTRTVDHERGGLGPSIRSRKCRTLLRHADGLRRPGQLQHAICKSSDGAIVVLFPGAGMIAPRRRLRRTERLDRRSGRWNGSSR